MKGKEKAEGKQMESEHLKQELKREELETTENLGTFFPFWDQLTAAQKSRFQQAMVLRHVKKGTIISNGNKDCTGLILVDSGRLRAYISSDEGREITLYRLLDMDICLFSASCMIRSLQFDIIIEAGTDTTIRVISPAFYKSLMEESAPVANFTNELMASRLSDVMWLVEQIMWKSLDKRMASFLLEESTLEGTDTLEMTHEMIANHLGTHREVITRMLRYFQNEEIVRLSRGAVRILDPERLREIAG